MGRRYKKEVNLKKNQKIVKIILALICIIGFLIIQKSYAKYVIQASDIHTQKATSFYFESDLVEEETKTYNISNWDGNSYDISFYIRNYTDDLQKSDEDISYKISAEATGNATISLNDSKSNNISSTDILTLQYGDYKQTVYILTVNPTTTLSEGESVTVTVTITSTAPYVKTMTAVINLTVETTPESYEAKLTNNGEYVTLTLEINDASSNITIEYDTSTLVLDISSAILSGSTVTAGKIVIPSTILETGQIIEIYFAKVDVDDTIVLDEDITVT